MIIECKDWHAQHDKMPPGSHLRVQGAVTVSHPGIVPVLVKRATQDRSMGVALELELQQQDGSFLQVACDKEVLFETHEVHDSITKVDIFHDGQLIACITDIVETH
ncbi:hypothetical protein ACNFBR_18205 [Pseudomonas sp. NY11955]|uniref:hypothetical protein n=1 Tax=Pseudomonas sp. NY11955 TaxID=3400363 RepID=UPI003A840DB1